MIVSRAKIRAAHEIKVWHRGERAATGVRAVESRQLKVENFCKANPNAKGCHEAPRNDDDTAEELQFRFCGEREGVPPMFFVSVF
jgi:hypothetical protein